MDVVRDVHCPIISFLYLTNSLCGIVPFVIVSDTLFVPDTCSIVISPDATSSITRRYLLFIHLSFDSSSGELNWEHTAELSSNILHGFPCLCVVDSTDAGGYDALQ